LTDIAITEILLRKPYSGFLADVYSLGIVLHILLCGNLPYSFEERSRLLVLFRMLPDVLFEEKAVSASAADLMRRMLAFSPAKRISLDEVRSHPWVLAAQE
jgi:serine/threonine protein kinase